MGSQRRRPAGPTQQALCLPRTKPHQVSHLFRRDRRSAEAAAKASGAGGGCRAKQGGRSPESGARNSEARRDVPGPGRAANPPFFSRARGARRGLQRRQARPRRQNGPGRETKGPSRRVGSSPADLSRRWGLAPRSPPGVPDPGT